MSLQHSEIDALVRELDELATKGAAPEIAEAREAIQRAADSLGRHTPSTPLDSDGERALALARMALDRVRRVVGAARPRPSWQEALRAPLSAPTEARAGRRPLGVSPTSRWTARSPDAHPAKSAIEAAVTGAFAGVRGRWRVTIMVPPAARWWGIRVEGESICWTGTLEGPDEQAPEFLSGRVREAVQLGLMQSALPRRRRPRA